MTTKNTKNTKPAEAQAARRRPLQRISVIFVAFVVSVVFVLFVLLAPSSHAQSDITDAQLAEASAGRVVRVGPAAGGPASTGRATIVPLEVYVARVIAGEGEPRAAEAAQQALAIAIRTYALANAGRHSRDGFDLCDSIHCQVPRAATAASRRVALATAGQVLTYNGAPAELFYSASCGGHSETASEVWPGANYPYLKATRDDVHEDDVPWTLELTLLEVERALRGAGFEGRLHDVRVDERSASGRAARLRLPGLVPDVIGGAEFRTVLGTTILRSTAFSVDRRGSVLRFTGRGYGHGVGMCVIGAGRRAQRGERAEAILAQYYPGLALTRLGAPGPAPVAAATPLPPAPPAAGTTSGGAAVLVHVASSSTITAAHVERLAALAQRRLATALGVSMTPMTIRVHDTLDGFRRTTGRPWWVSSVSEGTTIELAPAALLEQRNGLEPTLRQAVAELLVAPMLADRPRWVRIGAARYFARETPGVTRQQGAGVRCPWDAELALAISAAAQREAEARAESCFAREYARTRDWRAVR